MFAILTLVLTIAFLPNYAIGQPLSDARVVAPLGFTPETWVLRCAGDRDAPPGLVQTESDRKAHILRCWPMIRTPSGEQRAAIPHHEAQGEREELIFRDNRIADIKIRVSDNETEIVS